MSSVINWPHGPNSFDGSDVTIDISSSNNEYTISDNKSNKSVGILSQVNNQLTFQVQVSGSTTQTFTVKV